MAAVITTQSSQGWRAEPLFSRPTGAASPTAHPALPVPPEVDQWKISLASIVTAAVGMKAVSYTHLRAHETSAHL
eukprot:10577123-Alexandrium_andersonii.AAC.1